MDMKKLIKETIEEMLREGDLELSLDIKRTNFEGIKIKVSINKIVYHENGFSFNREELTSAEDYL